jgi:hypothetical protein
MTKTTLKSQTESDRINLTLTEVHFRLVHDFSISQQVPFLTFPIDNISHNFLSNLFYTPANVFLWWKIHKIPNNFFLFKTKKTINILTITELLSSSGTETKIKPFYLHIINILHEILHNKLLFFTLFCK